MNLIHRSQIQMLATLQVFGILALASFAMLGWAEEPSVEALKARIEGVYVLQEWHRHGEIFRPPLVDARTVLLNGHIMFISHDWAQEPNKTTVAGYGIYILEPGKFSYRYERSSMVTQTAAGTSVSENLPWEGLRPFATSIENNEIRFRAKNGPREFRFTAGGMSYSDGNQVRVYRRVTDK